MRHGLVTGAQPDIACLQEIKSIDEAFPRLEIESLGYHVETHGQKGFNWRGAVVESLTAGNQLRSAGRRNRRTGAFHRGRLAARRRRGAGSPRSICRMAIRLAQKFSYKLAWMKRLEAWAAGRPAFEEPLVLAGDYNVIPSPEDTNRGLGRAMVLDQPESRDLFSRLKSLGFTEAVRRRPTPHPPTHSGIIRPARGRRTTASALIICSVSGSRRPVRGRGYRQACQGLGKAVRSCAGVGVARE